MARKTTKPNAADAYNASQIARAVYFTAHFRVGPTDKRTIRCETLEQARVAASELNAEHGQFGRRATVYAINPEGASFHVS